ncbi:glycosyltransferase family 4 protein [Qipengyuania sp. MTN3-11]|uniref:glycosyltransferase family 4 protein n=1 Tax=Qipengyuania sp. MTN3-11 TaxID=3056557 RepID=UPI0036F1DA89
MRIAMITSGASSIPNFRGPLIRYLCERGHEVIAMAPDWTDDLRARTRAAGAEVMDISLDRAGIRPFRDAADLWRLKRQLAASNVDVVLSYFVKPAIFGSLAARAAGIPRRVAMIEGLGYLFTEDGERATLKRKMLSAVAKVLFRLGLRAADRVVFLNREDAALFADMRLVEPAKVAMLGAIGVDLTQLRPTPAPVSPVTFLMMGRLLWQKGVREYIAAARKVRSVHPQTRFVLLGDRDANPTSVGLEELIGWVDEGVIEWPGHVDNVPEWVAGASVFVLPSYYREGVPRSSQEAAALGRAIITTDSVGCRETVQDGRNGFLVPVRSPDALAEAMTRFVEHPDLIVSMGARSREFAEERFDARDWNRAMTELLIKEQAGEATR